MKRTNRLAIGFACLASVLGIAALLAIGTPAGATAASVQRIDLNYGDPGFAYFDGTYYVYGTSQGSGFPVASSSRYNGTYTSRGAILRNPPSWVGTAPTLGKRMWAPEVFRVSGPHRWVYVLYYTAWDAKAARNCIGVASSLYPTHGFTPTAGPICAPRSQPASAEAIDPTDFVSTAGARYMIFKTSVGNRSDWKIWALPMNALGTKPTGIPPRVKYAASNRMESPSLIHHGGRIWLFVSRNWYNQCNYLTQAFSAGQMWAGAFTFQRTLLSAANGLPCGNGGAGVINVGNSTRMVFFSHGSAISNPRRDETATIKWTAKGQPYVA